MSSFKGSSLEESGAVILAGLLNQQSQGSWVRIPLLPHMAHKKRSKGGSGTYAAEHRYEKNKVRKMETYLRHNPNDLDGIKRLQEMKEKWKSVL